MNKYLSYEEFIALAKDGKLTEDGSCPVTPLLVMLQGKWKTQVLYHVSIRGRIRFSDLKKEMPGITNAMLTNALRDLEKDGFIIREQFNEIPPRVEYSVSDMGKDLMPVFYLMTVWGMKYGKG